MLIDLGKNKRLTIYRSILINFWDYYQMFPMTVSDSYIDRLTDVGLKCIPTDPLAIEILLHTLSTYEKPSACVQHLLNDKFENLPIMVRPVTAVDKTHGKFVTAKWNVAGSEHTSVWRLINLDGGKEGFWSFDDKKVKVSTN